MKRIRFLISPTFSTRLTCAIHGIPYSRHRSARILKKLLKRKQARLPDRIWIDEAKYFTTPHDDAVDAMAYALTAMFPTKKFNMKAQR